MTPKNRVVLLIVTTVSALFMLQSAWAIRVTNEPPSSKDSETRTQQPPVRSGTIDTIDLRNMIIVVDRVAYLFTGTAVLVHSIDPSVVSNSLELRKGQRIRFAIKKEASTNKERVTEVWITEDKARPNKAK